jgi:anhydro-N-acetylmuramic acid kinase
LKKPIRRPFTACGIMSGTSRDGIDIAFIEITGRFPANKIRLIHSETRAYPSWLRKKLMLPPTRLTVQDIATLDFLLGRLFGKAALKAAKSAGLERDQIDVIGSHGQTLLHQPRGVGIGPKQVRSTLQVGSGAVVAQATGVATVSDFRSSDIAVGGEGAPLVPVFDYVIFRSPRKSRVALNVGGISNLTALPRKADLCDILSFDTGPGNCMIDTAVRLVTRGRKRYDRNGKLALSGRPDTDEVKAVLAHPYFKRKPPKSTGWEEFGEEFTNRLVDRMKAKGRSSGAVLRTISEAVCESIKRALSDFVLPRMDVDEVIVTGGGSHNLALMRGLTTRLSPARVVTGEAVGIPSDTKEACAFAYLAYLALKRIPANVMSQASGLKPAILGAIHQGVHQGVRSCN